MGVNNSLLVYMTMAVCQVLYASLLVFCILDVCIVYDTMNENLDKYSVDELIEEVNEYYPEILEN